MFLEVLANTRQVNFDWYVDFGEDIATTDTGELQEMRARQRPARSQGYVQ